MEPTAGKQIPEISLAHGRFCVVLAAVLWSLSGLFSKLLREPTSFGLDQPELTPLQISFFRVFFAALVLLPGIRFRDVAINPLMWPMAITFAVMNVLFISAMTLGTAASAILLQYTAPMWMFLVGVFLFREKVDIKNIFCVILGSLGILVIVLGNWEEGKLEVVLLGVGSGMTYAGILLFLRALRSESSSWLTAWNHLCAAILLSPLALGNSLPTWQQLLTLALFGGIQLGFPYFLVARGLRVVHPLEVGAITLLEPILNPLWAYLTAPEKESLHPSMLAGGAFILVGLVVRYLPSREKTKKKAI